MIRTSLTAAREEITCCMLYVGQVPSSFVTISLILAALELPSRDPLLVVDTALSREA